MKIFDKFKPKRKQCCKCYKTFFKTTVVYDPYYQVKWEVSPCCHDEWIIV